MRTSVCRNVLSSKLLNGFPLNLALLGLTVTLSGTVWTYNITTLTPPRSIRFTLQLESWAEGVKCIYDRMAHRGQQHMRKYRSVRCTEAVIGRLNEAKFGRYGFSKTASCKKRNAVCSGVAVLFVCLPTLLTAGTT